MRDPQEFIDDLIGMLLSSPFLFFVSTCGFLTFLFRTEWIGALLSVAIAIQSVRVYALERQATTAQHAPLPEEKA